MSKLINVSGIDIVEKSDTMDYDEFDCIFTCVENDKNVLSDLINAIEEELDYKDIYDWYSSLEEYDKDDIEDLYDYMKKDYEDICNKIRNNDLEFIYEVSLVKITKKEVIQGIFSTPYVELVGMNIDSNFFDIESFNLADLQTEIVFENIQDIYEGIYEAFDKDHTFTIKINSYIKDDELQYIVSNTYEGVSEMES